MITIINYGLGNIKAIGNIYERLNLPFKIANTPYEVEDAEKILLPGVGAFDEAVSMLEKSGFRDILDHKVLVKGIPILGICVGMQMLARKSDEGCLPGLGWIGGEVKKINPDYIHHKPKLPHLGWNSIKIKQESPILNGIDKDEGFYFLHSYYFQCDDEIDSLATTLYGHEFTSIIKKKNIYGVQFHPEKSHNNGIQLLKNFALLEV